MAKELKFVQTPGERCRLYRKRANMTQAQLAETIHCSVDLISAMERGRRTLTVENATAMSAIFGVRKECLLCFDDFETEDERMEHSLDIAWDHAKVLDSLIRQVASNFQYEIQFIDPQKKAALENVNLGESCFAIIENGKVIACIPGNDYFNMRHEIAHYATYLFSNIVERQKKLIAVPFTIQKGEDNNGQH